jgi:hypothetical protein
MMGWSEEMAAHHDRRNFPLHVDAIFSSLSMLAAMVEEDERAAYWAQRGFDEAAHHKHLLVMGLTGQDLFTPLVLQGQIVEALDRIRHAMRASWCTHLLRQQGRQMDAALEPSAVLGTRSNERWHGAERWAIQQGVLPLLLHFSRMRLHDPVAAAQAVEELNVYIGGLGDAIALPSEWQAAMSFVRKSIDGADNWLDVRREAEHWPDDSPHGLRWLGYAACTLQNDVPLDQASTLHARLGWYVERRLGSRTTLQRRIVLPFFETYWQQILSKRATELLEPGPLEAVLFKGTVASRERSPRTILNAALRACDARIPNSQREVKKWLQGQ